MDKRSGDKAKDICKRIKPKWLEQKSIKIKIMRKILTINNSNKGNVGYWGRKAVRRIIKTGNSGTTGGASTANLRLFVASTSQSFSNDFTFIRLILRAG